MTADPLLLVRRAWRQFCLALGIIAGLAGLAGGAFAAQSVQLTWGPSTTTSVVAYKVYFGTQSGVYPNSVAYGLVTDATIPGLQDGVTYYFAVTAVIANGSESPFSNEAMYTAPISTSSITLLVQPSTNALGAVQLTWTASSDSDIYGYSINYWTPGSDDTNSVQFYGVTNALISGLSGTNYFFTVSPIDEYGVEAVASAAVPFTLPGPQAIILTAQPASSTSGVLLSWNIVQNEGIVSYNAYYETPGQNYGYSLNCGNTNRFLVQGLTAGQTYYFNVAPVDTYGNVGAYSEEAVAVAPAPAPIQISAMATTNAMDSVNITWVPSSDPTVTGYAIYCGPQSGNYNEYYTYSGVTNGLINGLTPGTTYYFAAAPIDAFGIESIASSEISYTVEAPAPSVLSVVQTNNPSGVTLSWTPIMNAGVASYDVYYGTQSGAYNNEVSYGSTVTNAVIDGLEGGQTYYFAVVAQDSYGDQNPYSDEVSAVAPNGSPMVLQSQVYTDGNGQPYELEITTPSTVFGNWEVDSSTDLQNWTPYAVGSGSGTGDGYDVDVWVTIDPTQPQVFFRAFTY